MKEPKITVNFQASNMKKNKQNTHTKKLLCDGCGMLQMVSSFFNMSASVLITDQQVTSFTNAA